MLVPTFRSLEDASVVPYVIRRARLQSEVVFATAEFVARIPGASSKRALRGATHHHHVDSKLPWLKIQDGLGQLSSEHTPFRDEAARFPLD
jgi:hypothetical protein